MNALAKLFEVVAPALGVPADHWKTADSRVQVKGNPSKNLNWQAACRKLGTKTISEMGENAQRGPGGLIGSGVGRRADRRCFGGYENRHGEDEPGGGGAGLRIGDQPEDGGEPVLRGGPAEYNGGAHRRARPDPVTGRILNANMEFYKLTGSAMWARSSCTSTRRPEHDKRGVIGLGEPPVIGGIAAIANEVQRDRRARPGGSLTPDKVLAACKGGTPDATFE